MTACPKPASTMLRGIGIPVVHLVDPRERRSGIEYRMGVRNIDAWQERERVREIERVYSVYMKKIEEEDK